MVGKAKRRLVVAASLGLLILTSAAGCLILAQGNLDGRQQAGGDGAQLDVRVFGHSELFSGSRATIRVVTADFETDAPISGAAVRIELGSPGGEERTLLCEQRTNARGTLEGSFTVPELHEGDYRIEVQAAAAGSTGEVGYGVRVKNALAIYLTTDKPIYKPTQEMHIRALVMDKFNLKPLQGEQAHIEIEDPKGNKLFKKTQALSEFGIADARFTLADEISTGRYTIRLRAGRATAEKKVTVDRYVLPKFQVQCDLDKDFYMPKDTVVGSLRTEYFFGKPVAGAGVEVKASTFDVAFRQFTAWQGKTDETGSCRFEITLPDYFVGQPLTQGKGLVSFEIAVTDTADHKEKKTVNTTVSEGSLVMYAIPRRSAVVPGLENTVFIATTYPDGSPARCRASWRLLDGAGNSSAGNFSSRGGRGAPLQATLETDEMGLCELKLAVPKAAPAPNTPCRLHVRAVDERGNTAEKTFDLERQPGDEGLLVVPDKCIYKVGDTMRLAVLSTQPGSTIYLDIVKDKQTLLTRSFDLSGGRGSLSLDIPPDLFGLLEIHAYQIRRSLNMIRDATRVFVNRADDLDIEISLDKSEYLPADKAVLEFQVKDGAGHPVLAALGLYIVDEAVFGLSELQPGLEKVFFMLEKELLTPRYQIRGVTKEILLGALPADPEGTTRQQRAARVLFSSTEPPPPLSLVLSSREEQIKQLLAEAQRKIWEAAQARARAGKGWITVDLKTLVKEGFLAAEDLCDPWGHSLIRGGCTCPSCVQRHLVLVSWGPDAREQTGDDLLIDTRGLINQEVEELRAFNNVAHLRRRGTKKGLAEGEAMVARLGFAAAKDDRSAGEAGAASTPAPVALVREFFPETLLVVPQLITDALGRARREVDLADSITTWRLSACASSPSGALGSTTHPIRVFQDFFVDIDFPVALTQNDIVAVPIAVYNYLDKPQQVRLVAEDAPWLQLLEGEEQIMALEPGEVTAAYFPVRVKQIGRQSFCVKAYGAEMSDAIRRAVEVVPRWQTVRDRLQRADPGRGGARSRHPAGQHQGRSQDRGEVLSRGGVPAARRHGWLAAHAFRVIRADVVLRLPEHVGAGLRRGDRSGHPRDQNASRRARQHRISATARLSASRRRIRLVGQRAFAHLPERLRGSGVS